MKYLSIDLPEAWGQADDPNIYRQEDEGGQIDVLSTSGEWQKSGAWGQGSGVTTLEQLRDFYVDNSDSPTSATWRAKWLTQEDIDALLRTA